MYNTMVKLRNKKAFTLVEMMAVIAIVAVLVAVVVPIIGKSTTKARAATNAANLRSVESELATMKVSNPDYFIAATETTMTTAEQWQQSAYKYVYNFWYGEDEYTLKMDSIPAVSGTLSFYTNNFLKEGTAITLSGVPTSVALSADSNMNMEDGTQMYIFLSGNTFTAAYKGTDDAGKEVYFDKDCFAEVAETGKFTGTGVSSDDGWKDKIEETLDKTVCSDGGLHNWTVTEKNPSEHTCTECDAHYAHEDRVGGLDLTDGNGIKDGKCDALGCSATCGTAGSGIAHVWDSHGVCGQCGATSDSHVHQDNGNAVGPVTGTVYGNPDGKCDYCGKHVHKIETIDGIAKCKWVDCGLTKCKIEGKQHEYENGTCNNCGAAQEHDHVDNNEDHKCDYCPEIVSKCADNDNDHNCDVCGTELSKCIDEDKNYYCDICKSELEHAFKQKGDRGTDKYKCYYCDHGKNEITILGVTISGCKYHTS